MKPEIAITDPRPPHPRRIVAVRGAKGGCGSSMIAANLGVFLAKIGKRVLLVDTDYTIPGLHTWLASPFCTGTLEDFLNSGDPLTTAIGDTSVRGLHLLQGSKRIQSASARHPDNYPAFWKRIQSLEADFIIVDLPPGLDSFTLQLFTAADIRICVTTPMPDTVEGTYRFMVSAWLWHLSQVLSSTNEQIGTLLRSTQTRQDWPISPRQILSDLTTVDVAAADRARWHLERFHPLLIVNQVKIKADESLGDAMVSAGSRWLGIASRFLGSIAWDENAWMAQRNEKILLIDFARTRICKDLEKIVRSMINLDAAGLHTPVTLSPMTAEQTYYDLLDIYPGASEEEVRRAMRQIRIWFGHDSLASRGACTCAQRDQYQQMAEDAYAKLLDRYERRQYDRHHFPEGFARTAETRPSGVPSIVGTIKATHDLLPQVELTDDHFVGGAFLGQIRKQHHVELLDISNRAKISVRYLQAIEEERFDDLPVEVFTRGFVTEFAKYLKIDPARATRDFMAAWDSHFEKKRK